MNHSMVTEGQGYVSSVVKSTYNKTTQCMEIIATGLVSLVIELMYAEAPKSMAMLDTMYWIKNKDVLT